MKHLIESLEGRRLFSTVTWDGGGGTDSSLNTAANWSNDILPTANDDAVISITTGKTLVMASALTVRSLTLANNVLALSRTLSVSTEFRVESGASVNPFNGTVQGAGKFIVDVGGKVFPAIGGSQAFGGNITVPVDNYGTFGFAGTGDIGPAFHNYATAIGYDTTVAYGTFYNEAGATLTTQTVPNQPGSVTLGLQRSSSGVISAAPFYNHGTIFTGPANITVGPTPVGNYSQTSLLIYVDASPTLGGTWSPTGAALRLASYNRTSPATLALDSSFTLTAGTLNLDQVNATVHGFATDSALSVNSDAAVKTTVTLDQNKAELSLLAVFGSAVLKIATGAGGNRVLHPQDFRLAAAATIDVGDNLFLDGNQPGYLQDDDAPRIVHTADISSCRAWQLQRRAPHRRHGR